MRNARGFTAIEIISVILLLGILTAIAIPMFSTTVIDVESSAQAVRADLRMVQQLALARDPTTGGAIGILFTPGATSYTISDPAGVFTTTRDLPNGAAIGTVTIGAPPTANKLSFNRYGEPEFTGTNATIQVTKGAQTKTLTVERFTGRVTIS